MLSTLIYRSRLNQHVDAAYLAQIAFNSRLNNEKIQVTGILLFDGTHFFQVLEGPFDAVNTVYENICRDRRHDSIVELMRDYAPKRRFGNFGMELFDLRQYPQDAILAAILAKGTAKYNLTYDDRVLKFIRTFVEGLWKDQPRVSSAVHEWQFTHEAHPFLSPDQASFNHQPCQFALQPIINPLARRISSLEALIRGPEGGPPAEYFSAVSKEKIYEADLYSKFWAFSLASKIGQSHMISINLLPMSFVMVPNAVDILLEQIAINHLVPEQVIVEVTEDEVISRFDEFDSATRQLRSAGINLAIDDFGSGFAGLSLLAKFQPDKIKIDRSIITDVHKNGAKQAIVQAIVKCCSSLEIAVVAEGVEKVEEWCWLEAAGITLFQGFLFARPMLNGVSSIAWPQKVVSQI